MNHRIRMVQLTPLKYVLDLQDGGIKWYTQGQPQSHKACRELLTKIKAGKATVSMKIEGIIK